MKETLLDLSMIKIRLENEIKEREAKNKESSFEESKTNVLKAALEELNNVAQNIHIFLNS